MIFSVLLGGGLAFLIAKFPGLMVDFDYKRIEKKIEKYESDEFIKTFEPNLKLETFLKKFREKVPKRTVRAILFYGYDLRSFYYTYKLYFLKTLTVHSNLLDKKCVTNSTNTLLEKMNAQYKSDEFLKTFEPFLTREEFTKKFKEKVPQDIVELILKEEDDILPFYNAYIPCSDNTIRMFIDYSDKQYTEKLEELAIFTDNFLKNVKFPVGLKKLLNYDDEIMYPDNLDGIAVMPFKYDKLVDENIYIILQINDYYTQFRKIVFFATDEYDAMKFFLDYGKNEQNPTVKVLNCDTDEIYPLTITFNEFAEKCTDIDGKPLSIFKRRKKPEIL